MLGDQTTKIVLNIDFVLQLMRVLFTVLGANYTRITLEYSSPKPSVDDWIGVFSPANFKWLNVNAFLNLQSTFEILLALIFFDIEKELKVWTGLSSFAVSVCKLLQSWVQRHGMDSTALLFTDIHLEIIYYGCYIPNARYLALECRCSCGCTSTVINFSFYL